ncbi:MAG: hypothetical protein LBQ66_05990, partial [Planctomycetaceae bacterium]|nr:hypothetical protein [Planctomycetaceae bacterium]
MPIEIPIHFPHHWGRGQASPLQYWAFWFYRYVFRPRCFRLAPLAENATAQRSVAHLTITTQKNLCGITRAGCPRSSPSRLRKFLQQYPIFRLLNFINLSPLSQQINRKFLQTNFFSI